MKLTQCFPWLAVFLLLLSNPLWAGDGPEVIYQVWVNASRAGDIDKLLAISSATKAEEFHQEISTPEKKEEIRNIMKAVAPKSYEVKRKVVSPDGNKVSLFVEALEVDFFSLNDPKAKPEKQNVEVRLVKEGGEWKIDQQCNGKDGCGKEPEWTQAGFGKTLALPNKAGLKVVSSHHPEFKTVKLKGQPYSVDLVFDFPENTSLFYFLHRSPKFAELYLQVGETKITPIASLEDFPPADEKEIKKAELLEENVSYSKSHQFSGKGAAALLFDVPANAKGPKTLRIMITVNDQKLSFEVK
jgi:hypothetical protein